MNAAERATLAKDMLISSGAASDYWCGGYFERNDEVLVITGDDEGTDTEWPVRVEAKDFEEAHRRQIFQRGGIKGVHPSNYGWISHEDDYDHDTVDWVLQYLVFGEVVYG